MCDLMRAIRRAPHAAGLAFWLSVSLAAPASAQAPTLEVDPLRFFADCRGRVAALRVDRLSFADARGLARAEVLGAALDDLVAAMTPADQAGTVRTWAAQARAAQAALMRQAAEGPDPAAAALADRFIALCVEMLVLPEDIAGVAADPA